MLTRAAEVLRSEADGLLSIINRLDENFVRAVELLKHCKGKVVVTGVGKSGLICAKIAATLSSTGTPAFFLHAGDALAVVLLELKGFKETDFAMRHPGGMLGRKLLLRVVDLMVRGERLPLVSEMTSVKDALFEITAKRLGVTGVINAQRQLVGVLTDGDLRRGLESKGEILSLAAKDLMTRNPKTIPADTLASEAVAVMEKFPITSLFIIDSDTKVPVGVVHLHDLIKAGL